METLNIRKVNDIQPEDYRRRPMEIINKSHEEILSNQSAKGVFIKFHNLRQIYFSIMAVKKFGINPGLTAHFVNDDNEWFFYLNNDPDGFAINQSDPQRPTSIFNESLVKMFIKRSRFDLPCKFLLTETKAKLNGATLIKIELHKPID